MVGAGPERVARLRLTAHIGPRGRDARQNRFEPRDWSTTARTRPLRAWSRGRGHPRGQAEWRFGVWLVGDALL